MKSMKFFSLTVVAFFIFCATQAQVCIPDSVARYFLEQNDRAKILSKVVKMQDKVIDNFQTELQLKETTIKTYQKDSATFTSIIKTKDDEISFNKKQLEYAKKEIKKQKFIKILVIIGAGVVVILTNL